MDNSILADSLLSPSTKPQLRVQGSTVDERQGHFSGRTATTGSGEANPTPVVAAAKRDSDLEDRNVEG